MTTHRKPRRFAALTVAATSLGVMPLLGGGEAITAPPPRAGAAVAIAANPRASAEHRYRISAKIRLGLFSLRRDDVGSALMTSRSTGEATAFALLAGSDPNRVPGNLNRWAYVREEVRDDSAEVFSVRSDDAVPDAHARGGDAMPFNAGCTSVTTHDVHSSMTTVDAPDATYRRFDRLLERLEATPAKWNGRYIARPPGMEPGFLSAMHNLLSGHDVEAVKTHGAVTYVFNNKLYDLAVKRVRSLGRTTVGSRTFEQLTQVDLMVRSRTSGDVTRFAVTTVLDGSEGSLPVQIFFQPSFWIVVELRVDDQVDVPRDPADDGSLLTRMRGICASVTR